MSGAAGRGAASDEAMLILVIGSALRAVCGDPAALGLTFVEETRTQPRYRLYALEGRFAGLVDVGETGGGSSVPGELVEIPRSLLEAVQASEPAGVSQAATLLADGRSVSCAHIDLAVVGAAAVDITSWGGFLPYWRSLQS